MNRKILKQFVTKDIALGLKEIGFNKDCILGWDKEDQIRYNPNPEYSPDPEIVLNCPMWSQVQDWVMEEFNLFIGYSDVSGFLGKKKFIYCISILHTNHIMYMSGGTIDILNKNIEFDSLFEAKEDSIKKIIQLRASYQI